MMTPTPKPEHLQSLPPDRLVELDVREAIRQGEEPFPGIMAAVERLGPDHVLVLRTPFEPIPLYHVLARRGFAHWSEARAADDWSVWFWHTAPSPSPSSVESAGATVVGPLEVDVRGLEPPLPMVRILELLDRLEPGQVLVVTHERRPTFLYPQLEQRGFSHQTHELEPGQFRIVIWREGASA